MHLAFHRPSNPEDLVLCIEDLDPFGVRVVAHAEGAFERLRIFPDLALRIPKGLCDKIALPFPTHTCFLVKPNTGQGFVPARLTGCKSVIGYSVTAATNGSNGKNSGFPLNAYSNSWAPPRCPAP